MMGGLHEIESARRQPDALSTNFEVIPMVEKFKDHLSSLEYLELQDIAVKGSKKYLCSGYRNTKSGLYKVTGKDIKQVTYGPIVPVSKGVGTDKQSYPQLNLLAINSFGCEVEISVDMSNFDERGLANLFDARGVSVCSGQSRLLETFLKRLMTLKMDTLLVADQNGPVDGQYAFMIGNDAYYDGDLTGGFSDIVRYQSDQLTASLCNSGSYEAWREGVAKFVSGEQQIFALTASFASYFMSMLGKDNFIVHFYGGSTTGKTTLLQLAASVYGYAGEPGDQKQSMLSSWNSTSNGIEGYLTEHSGALMLLDELGTYRGKDLDQVVYQIAAGKSKNRMSKTLRQSKPRTWGGIIISSGELSVPERLAIDNKELTEGMQHRAISLQVFIEDSFKDGSDDVEAVRARADGIKQLVVEHYGVAIRELLVRLTGPDYFDDGFASHNELHVYLDELIEQVEGQLLADIKERSIQLSPAQRRALHRFACIGAFGSFLAEDGELDMMPFTIEENYNSVLAMFLRWVSDDCNQFSPEKKVLVEIYKQLQQKQHSNFAEARDDYIPSQFWGYHDKNHFFILDSIFEGWCQKHNIQSFKVAKLLVDAGYLSKEGDSHYKKRRKFNGTQYNVFQLSKDYLDADVEVDF